MDYTNFNKIMQDHPLVLMDDTGECYEFTSFPSYQDLEKICARSPMVTADAEVIGRFTVGENAVLDTLREYRMELIDKGLASGQFLAALDDLADTVDSFNTTQAQDFIDDVLEKVGDDQRALSIVFNSFVDEGRKYLEKNDLDKSEVYSNLIQYLGALYPFLDAHIETVDDRQILEDEFENADEDATFIQLTIGGEVLTVPLTANALDVLSDIMPVMYNTIEELGAMYKPGQLSPLETSDLPSMLQEQYNYVATLPDYHEADAVTLNDISGAMDKVSALYANQLGQMVSDYLDSEPEEAKLKALMDALDNWAEDLTLYRPEYIPEEDGRIIATIHTQLREQLAERENECRAEEALVQKDREYKNGENGSVFCTYAALSQPHLH